MKAAIITGAAGGIGQSLCISFKQAGFFVVATDVNNAPKTGDKFVTADLNIFCKNENYRTGIVQNLQQAIGENSLSVLINNAAIQILGSVEKLEVNDWQQTLHVNLVAPFLLTQAFLKALSQTSGSVINIGSVHATQTKPGFTCYATSKAALLGMTRALAIDIGPRVRVNAINPAAVATSMLKSGFKGKENLFKKLSHMHPIERIAEPEEISQVALFLASEQASFMTGSSIDVDGGILGRLHDPG